MKNRGEEYEEEVAADLIKLLGMELVGTPELAAKLYIRRAKNAVQKWLALQGVDQ